MTEPKTVAELQKYAAKNLPPLEYTFYNQGSGDNYTVQDNKDAYARLRLRPRILRDVSIQDCSTTVLGRPASVPFGASPTAMQRLAHVDAEMATAKATAAAGGVFILSTYSSVLLEDIAKEIPNGRKWLQIYVLTDRKISESLIKRAEAAGFEAIAVSVDIPVLGHRSYSTASPGVVHMPSYVNLVNIEKSADYCIYGDVPGNPDVKSVTLVHGTPDLSWKDVAYLKQLTKLPIILKGILTAEDALLAVQHNIEGIFVSNHGGRQIDGTPASIEALPEIVKAVRGKCEIYVDGGVTKGTDVFKALALGANMVFLGRAVIWGLAYNGQEGVSNVLEMIKSQLLHTMSLTGCQTIQDIEPNMVVHQSQYAKL